MEISSRLRLSVKTIKRGPSYSIWHCIILQQIKSQEATVIPPLGTNMSVPNITEIRPVIIEIFHSGSNWTNRLNDWPLLPTLAQKTNKKALLEYLNTQLD